MLRLTQETSIGTSIVRKKDTQIIPSLKRKNGEGVAQSDLEKVEEFNGQFTDVFNKYEHTQVPLLDRSAPFMNDIVISKDGVLPLLIQMFIKVAPSPRLSGVGMPSPVL